jgi:hypothetical protein
VRNSAGRGTSRRTLAGVWSERSVVDFGLARRATLESLRGTGPVTPQDACDAHPYLLRAARFHGEPTARDCPVCRGARLVELSYVYGEQLGRLEGRLRSRAELAEMAHEHGEFRVYVVEVCSACAWNHLVRSFVLGDGVDRRAGAEGTGAGDQDVSFDTPVDTPVERRAGLAPGSDG